ncbi:retrovirus-related Pol polyprotein from transposon TNT 1-94 [Trichonephila clavata]|uniref:Retrovirus-related Pol polyprotein from transposon TNT 1-94 n=1 Tax=Trichonephila clavata TaxID=2740835 RepID=A0A8X6FEQ1_TRICU|nr:retrovirus-related Pol polyprotein from transposon TNT 1-94 [Trichonephila clavata]
MEFKAHIEKLVGAANWSKWKRQIELLLRHNDVHDVVCRDRECPRLPAEASAEAISAYEKAQKDFIKDDYLAQLILVGNMDDSNAELTSVCTTSKSVWEKWLSVYEQSSGQRLDRLMEKFFRSEKELEDDIASHIAKLQRNFSELNDELRRVAKTTLPDLLLMSRIMSTLSSEYFEFKSVWESVPIEERSVNKLTERLRLIEMRLPSKSTDSTALVVTRKKVFKKPERKCYVCRKPGHLAKDCWKKGSKPKVEGDAFVCTVEGVPESEVWIADSGASAHMTKYKNCFVDFTKFVSPKPVYVGNSDAIMAYGHGTVIIEIKVNSKWKKHHLTEVWYVPDISKNLFSISQTLKRGFKFQASKDECSLLRDDRARLKGVRTVHGLYALEMRVLYPKVCVASADQSLQLWHERLCHQNKAHVKVILRKYQIKSDVKDSQICDGYCYGKPNRRPFGTRKQRTTTPGELINIDVCGPMQQQSLGGAKYYVCFKDDFTKYRRVFFMQSRNEVSKCLETLPNEAKNTAHMIKEVLSDGGGEVVNSTVKIFLEKSEISSHMEIVKQPLQTPEADMEKEIEEISYNAEDTEETLVQQSSRNLRDRSILKMPAKFDSFVLLAEHIEPEAYKEAMASEDSDKWLAAMKEELESLSNNNTWILVNLPSDRKAIASQAAKEAIWLNNLLKELCCVTSVPSLQMDIQSAIRLVKNPEFHNRTKHIDIRYKFIREQYENKQLNVINCSSEVQAANILTKPLAKDRFLKLKLMLGMYNFGN